MADTANAFTKEQNELAKSAGDVLMDLLGTTRPNLAIYTNFTDFFVRAFSPSNVKTVVGSDGKKVDKKAELAWTDLDYSKYIRPPYLAIKAIKAGNTMITCNRNPPPGFNAATDNAFVYDVFVHGGKTNIGHTLEHCKKSYRKILGMQAGQDQAILTANTKLNDKMMVYMKQVTQVASDAMNAAIGDKTIRVQYVSKKQSTKTRKRKRNEGNTKPRTGPNATKTSAGVEVNYVWVADKKTIEIKTWNPMLICRAQRPDTVSNGWDNPIQLYASWHALGLQGKESSARGQQLQSAITAKDPQTAALLGISNPNSTFDGINLAVNRFVEAYTAVSPRFFQGITTMPFIRKVATEPDLPDDQKNAVSINNYMSEMFDSYGHGRLNNHNMLLFLSANGLLFADLEMIKKFTDSDCSWAGYIAGNRFISKGYVVGSDSIRGQQQKIFANPGTDISATKEVRQLALAKLKTHTFQGDAFERLAKRIEKDGDNDTATVKAVIDGVKRDITIKFGFKGVFTRTQEEESAFQISIDEYRDSMPEREKMGEAQLIKMYISRWKLPTSKFNPLSVVHSAVDKYRAGTMQAFIDRGKKEKAAIEELPKMARGGFKREMVEFVTEKMKKAAKVFDKTLVDKEIDAYQKKIKEVWEEALTHQAKEPKLADYEDTVGLDTDLIASTNGMQKALIYKEVLEATYKPHAELRATKGKAYYAHPTTGAHPMPKPKFIPSHVAPKYQQFIRAWLLDERNGLDFYLRYICHLWSEDLVRIAELYNRELSAADFTKGCSKFDEKSKKMQDGKAIMGNSEYAEMRSALSMME